MPLNRSAMRRMVFPQTPRDMPGRRLVRSILRALHILAGGVLVGAYLFHQDSPVIHEWLAIACVSGILLFATDLHATFAVVLELRGLAVAAKVLLTLLLPFATGFELPIVIAILFIGASSSHLSRRFRHRLWLTSFSANHDRRRG